jgi:HEAT repeat protein/CHAT domain-containing protein
VEEQRAKLLRDLTQGTEWMRASAARSLSRVKLPGAAEALLSALQTETDTDVLEAIAKSLGELGDRQAVAPLVAMLRDARDGVLRAVAAAALGRLDAYRAEEPLIAALKDPDARVRAHAAHALSQLGDSVEHLLPMLGDEDPGVRSRVVYALGSIKDETTLEAIYAMLADPAPQVRADVVRSLLWWLEYRWTQDAARRIVKANIQPLLELLMTTEDDLADRCIQVLDALGWVPTNTAFGVAYWARKEEWDKCAMMGPIAIGALRRALSDEDRGRERGRDVVRALGRIRDSGSVTILMATVQNDPELRGEAARALGQIGDRRAVAVLLDALKHAPEDAAQALGQLRDARAIEPLIAQLRRDSGLMRPVAEALTGFGPSVVPKLLEVATDQRTHVRVVIAHVLGNIGDDSALDDLIKLLHDPRTGKTAAYALGKLGNRKALEPLVGALEAPDEENQEDIGIDELFFSLYWSPIRANNPIARESLRSAAAWALGQLGDIRAVDPLISALGGRLKDRSDVQREIVRALGVLGDVRAVEPLLTALNDTDYHGTVTAQIARSLARLGDARAVEPLIGLLEKWVPHGLVDLYGVSEACAEALGSLRDRKAVEPLLAIVAAKGPRSRSSAFDAAVRALGQLGDVRAIQPLIEVIDESEFTVGALTEIGMPAIEPLAYQLGRLYGADHHRFARALCAIGGRQVVEPLIDALGHTASSVRITIIQGLGKIEDRRAIEPLVELMTDKEQTIDVIRTAALVLGGVFGEQRAVEPLIAALEQPDSSVRQSAAKALGNCAVDGVFEPLIIALGDWNPDVRHAATQALGTLGNPRAFEPLLGALRDWHESARNAAAGALAGVSHALPFESAQRLLGAPDRGVRVAGVERLSDLGDRRAIDPLVASLRDADKSVRASAAAALDQLGWPVPHDAGAADYWIAKGQWVRLEGWGQDAIESLKRNLKDTDAQMRRSAARTLGWLDSPLALEPLVAALRDGDACVRRLAIQSLERIGSTEVSDSLLPCLKDKDQEVRAAAVRALGHLCARTAVRPLTELLADEQEPAVRALAAVALGRIGDPVVVEPLTTLLSSPDPNLRRAAALSLGQFHIPSATTTLISLLTDEASEFRLLAARLLGNAGDPGAVEPLVMTALEGNGDEAAAAHASLRNLIDASTVGAFAWLLQNGRLRDRAWRMLAEILNGFVGTEPIRGRDDLETRLETAIHAAANRAPEPEARANALTCYLETIRYYQSRINALLAPGGSTELRTAARFCWAIGRAALQRFVACGATIEAGQISQQLMSLAVSLGNDFWEWRSVREICHELACGEDDAVTLSTCERAVKLIDATWFLQPVKESGLSHFFADKALIFDELALCYVRLGAYAQAWETLEAAKTRYLGDLIVRRHHPPHSGYEPVIEQVWRPVVRARGIARGDDELGITDTRELIGLEPASDQEDGIIATPVALQALADHPAGEPSSVQRLVEDLWRVTAPLPVASPLVPAAREAFAIVREYVSQLILLRRGGPRTHSDSELRDMLDDGLRRLGELGHEDDVSELKLWPIFELQNALRGLLADRDAATDRRLLELEALREVLSLLGGVGTVMVSTRKRRADDPAPSTRAILSSTGSPRLRIDRAKEQLADDWDRLPETRWRFVTRIARGQPSSFAQLRAGITPRQNTAVVAFHVTEEGTIVHLARSAPPAEEAGRFLPSQPKNTALSVMTFPRVTLGYLQDLLSNNWVSPYRAWTEQGRPDQGMEEWELLWDSTLNHVHAELLGPIDKQLRAWGVKRVTLIPHRGLHLLPLHACWKKRGSGRTYLIDTYDLSYAPSATLLGICRERAAAAAAAVARSDAGLLAVSDPTGDLPFAAYEVSGIAGHFAAPPIVLSGSKARLERLVAQLPQTYIHFACHGRYSWSNPLESHLQLAGGSRLSLGELFDEAVGLSRTKLVVLSACESGLVEATDLADEYLSVAGGFLFAGTSSVISALWEVPDISTAVLFREFYRQHLIRNRDVASALRSAQRLLRDGTAAQLGLAKHYERAWQLSEPRDGRLAQRAEYYRRNPLEKPFTHPYHWAGFTYNGL